MRDYFAEEIENTQAPVKDYFAEEIEQSAQTTEPRRKANILDMIGMVGGNQANQGGRVLAEVGSGMLGNTPKLIPQVKESLQPTMPSEQGGHLGIIPLPSSLAISNVAGFVSPQSPINMLSAKAAGGITGALGGKVLAQGAGYAGGQ